ncbi:MAG: SMC-Scp complex subunit ScpB [Myxococcales bacterium 68-20]|nr:MAG: SMC-Scp complex subunit ScpB [Myxococcales bacterium 68-20]
MSKRKKPAARPAEATTDATTAAESVQDEAAAPPPPDVVETVERDSATTGTALPSNLRKRKKPAARPAEATTDATTAAESVQDEAAAPPPPDAVETVERDSATTGTALPSDLLDEAMETALESERALLAALEVTEVEDVETTGNVAGDSIAFPGRDDLDPPTVTLESDATEEMDSLLIQRRHLRGMLEALIFASDTPIKPKDLAKLSSAPLKQVTELLDELRQDYSTRGIHLEDVAGGWIFRTNPEYAPSIRDLTKQRPVKLSRAQVETIAIIAYRQPVTRPEIDDVRGVDSGPVLKVLLERDLVRILGKRDEPGRPLIYGTTNHFLDFFGLKSLKDLPTLREFTELTDESREQYEEEMGEPPDRVPRPVHDESPARDDDADGPDLENDAAHGEGELDAESMAAPAESDDDDDASNRPDDNDDSDDNDDNDSDDDDDDDDDGDDDDDDDDDDSDDDSDDDDDK